MVNVQLRHNISNVGDNISTALMTRPSIHYSSSNYWTLK